MTVPTAGELALLRSKDHETTLWLSIYKPQVVMAAQTNLLTEGSGLPLIGFDNVTEGSYANIVSGMTMLVGTTPGASDIGKVRVKEASPLVLTPAENNHIYWVNDLYITVIRFWEIQAIYPRIIANPSTGDMIWYKDYDITYTDQNDNLGSFICMGGHFAGFLDNGQCNVYYSASGTYNVGGENLSYHWTFQSGTPGTSNSAEPGYVSYGTTGHYTTTLIVSGTSSGVADRSYRHISIYDRPDFDASSPRGDLYNPILGWQLLSMEGSRDGNGYNARIKVWSSTSDIVDGALVTIFADDYYNGTKQSIGGNNTNRPTIVLNGYILDGSISYNYNDGSVEFNIGSPTEVMKVAEGFSVAVNSSTDPSGQAATDANIPSAWVLVKDMNCKKAMYHYLRWHSTVLLTTDFQYVGRDFNIQYFDADRASLFDALSSFVESTLVGEVVCDRYGKIWVEPSMAAYDDALTTYETTITLDKNDWMGTPIIDEIQNNVLAYLEMGGITYTGLGTGSSAALMACAPGDTPAYRGSIERQQGLALTNQNMLNTLVGNVFAYRNARYPFVEFDLAGNYRIFDIAPLEITKVLLVATDTPRGITWNAKEFHPNYISWDYNSRRKTFLPTINFHEVTQGFIGETIEIPEIPPDDGGGDDSDTDPTPPDDGGGGGGTGGGDTHYKCSFVSYELWDSADLLLPYYGEDECVAFYEAGPGGSTAYGFICPRDGTVDICLNYYGGAPGFTATVDITVVGAYENSGDDFVIFSDSDITLPGSSGVWNYSYTIVSGVTVSAGEKIYVGIDYDASANTVNLFLHCGVIKYV